MSDGTEGQRMKRAYQSAGSGVREKLRREAPLDEAVLQGLAAQDTLVVRGRYDHAEEVLAALAIPFALVEPEHVGQLRLRPAQTVLVNCPGTLDRRGLATLRAFVEAGGCLVTTDWALVHVLEATLPGVVAYNQRPTRDDVVRVEVVEAGTALLGGLFDPRDEPVWWLEGSSYPIRVLAPDRVGVLIRSAEMAARYGEAPIAVRFPVGQGVVFHAVSHFYLQRTETRTRRHQGAAAQFLAAKDLDHLRESVQGLNVGEVETAYTSSAFLSTLLIEHRRRQT